MDAAVPGDLPTETSFDYSNSAADWGLVWAAAAQCGMRGSGAGTFPAQQQPVIPPWTANAGNPNPYFIFPKPPTSCDALLAYEEMMLCVADKLEEVASTVKPLTWGDVASAVPPDGIPSGAWLIPPQNDQNKFIARDLAIYTLANIARLDGRNMGDSTLSGTCSALYAQATSTNLSTTTATGTRSTILFGVTAGLDPTYPPVPWPARTLLDKDFDQLLNERMLFEAQTLRAAGNLLKDLVVDSVYADIAGAEQRRALAIDPAKGNAIAWGNLDIDNGPYDSLAHAVRVMAGRWEIGTQISDPKCAGVDAQHLLQLAYGNDLDARRDDLPIDSKARAKAVQLFEKLGLVIPDQVAIGLSGAQLSAAVAGQMKAVAAASNGIAVADLGAQGTAIDQVVATTIESDLRFAANHVYRTYRMLTDTPDVAALGATPDAGLKWSTIVTPALPTGAAVVDGGLARTRLPHDISARVAGMLEASQCNEPAGWEASINADSPYPATSTSPEIQRGPNYVFQDAFSLAGTFRRRLAALQQDASAQGDSRALGEAVARGGLAELKNWAGPGHVNMYAASSGSTAGPDYALVYFSDFQLDELGLSSEADLKNQYVLVYGPPWVAECAAGLRSECPLSFESDYTMTASNAYVNDDSLVRRKYGITSASRSLYFDFKSRPSKFQPQWRSTIVDSKHPYADSHLYLVGRSDPREPGKGWVLGSLNLKSPTSAEGAATASFVVSSLRRDLFNAVMGYEAAPLVVESGAPSSSLPPSYCIDGADRNLFVPLENELTSDSDPYENSWKHYLTLANAAAQHADDLGKELIAIQAQQDMRRDAATEALSAICGGPVTLSSTATSDGDVSKQTTQDAVLDACINEPTTDVVFLGNDPFAGLSDAERTSHVKDQVLLCNGAGSADPLCDAKNHPILTTAGLGLTPAFVPPSLTKDCKDIFDVVASLRGAGLNDTSFSSALSKSWSTPSSMSGVSSTMRMTVRDDAAWNVRLAGSTVMDSESATLWPGCLRNGSGAAGCDFDRMPINRWFNQVFRDCGASATFSSRETQKLGVCGTDGVAVGAWFDPVAAELNSLRWRVQGAMWLLGGMQGELPSGAFDTPVLAGSPKLYGTVYQDNDPTTGTAMEFFSGVTDYQLGGDGNYFANGDLVETRAVGPLVPVGPRFAMNAPATPLPAWLVNNYYLGGAPPPAGDTSIKFLHARGSTPSYAFAKTQSGWGVAATEMARELGTHLGGLTCWTPDGAPAQPPLYKLPASWPSAQLIVAATKMNFTQNFDLRHIDTASNRLCYGQVDITGHVYGGCVPFDDTACHASPRQLAGAPRATEMTPDERAFAYVNSAAPCGVCDATYQLIGAYALACIGESQGALPSGSAPPQLQTVDDLPLLEAWIGTEQGIAQAQVGGLYLESVPKRVATDFATHRVGTGTSAGTHGQEVLALEAELQNLASAWTGAASELGSMRTALQGTRFGLQIGDLEENKRELNDQMARMRIYRAMAEAAANIIGGAFSGQYASILSGGEQAAWDGYELDNLSQIANDNSQEAKTQVQKLLNDLQAAMGPTWATLQKNLDGIRGSVAHLRQISSQIQSSELSAKYEVAKGTGDDFYSVGGRKSPVLLNIALRRQYDATARRYRDALKQARYMAYVARRAIEQRIGVRLETLATPVGALDAPKKWADDVCRMQGLDYASLIRESSGGLSGDPNVDADIISDFADAFIGDYVAKLGQFIEYYNIAFPSHDGDDTTIWSLRNDLLDPASMCATDAPNLLYYSADLRSHGTGVVDPSGHLLQDWILQPCESGASTCLSVYPGASLGDPKYAPDVSTRGGVTWLVDKRTVSGDAGVVDAASADSGVDAADSTSDANLGVTGAPTGVVLQTVKLDPGTYILSWWDQNRTVDGSAAASAGVPYRAMVYDESWDNPVAVWSDAPVAALGAASGDAEVADTAPDADAGPALSQWSPRRVLTISVTSSGYYHVAFGASVAGGGPGSVAIANVQLEKVRGGAPPVAYAFTGATRTTLDALCRTLSADDMRAAFSYHCDEPSSCYYELNQPIVVDTGMTGTPSLSLTSKIARGNFNYRHIDVSLNLVGTGVRDCTNTPTSDCFGSGFIEYSLQHDARMAGIQSWDGSVQFFNFGIGNIEHAKALAAERFITLPVGTADQGLLAQPGIAKPEYRGRPLDGSYRLRIWDSPSLRWDRVEDIQVVLHYRYWSQITGAANP